MHEAPPEALVISTRDAAEAAGAQIVVLQVLCDEITAKINRVQLAGRKLKERADELAERKSRYETALEAWARTNRQQEFGEEKTLDMRHVVLTFKKAPRAVRLLKDWTEELVLKALQRRKTLREYIRIRREINKQRILSDSTADAGRLSEATLKAVGLEIFQDEKFSIERKLEPAKP